MKKKADKSDIFPLIFASLISDKILVEENYFTKAASIFSSAVWIFEWHILGFFHVWILIFTGKETFLRFLRLDFFFSPIKKIIYNLFSGISKQVHVVKIMLH